MEYIAKTGDTWENICFKTLKNSTDIYRLLQLNDQYRKIFIFVGGEKIIIPDDIIQQKAVLPPWKE